MRTMHQALRSIVGNGGTLRVDYRLEDGGLYGKLRPFETLVAKGWAEELERVEATGEDCYRVYSATNMG